MAGAGERDDTMNALESRRLFLTRSGVGLAALAALQAADGRAADPSHFPARAKRVISLFQSGAPSQLDLFDHKPALGQRRGTELPDSVRRGQRLTGMTSR